MSTGNQTLAYIPIRYRSVESHHGAHAKLRDEKLQEKASEWALAGVEVSEEKRKEWHWAFEDFERLYGVPTWEINSAIGWSTVTVSKGAVCSSLYLEGHLCIEHGLPKRHNWKQRRFFLFDRDHFRLFPQDGDTSQSFSTSVLESMHGMRKTLLTSRLFKKRYQKVVWDLQGFELLARNLDWLRLLRECDDS